MRKFLPGLLFLVASNLPAANLLSNGSFEQVVQTSTFTILGSGNNTSITGWTVTGGNCGLNCVLVLKNNYVENSNVGTLNFISQDGNQSLDITGSGNTGNGGVSQTVNLTVGSLYNLSFWLGNMDNRAGNYGQSSTLEVLVNNVSQGSFTNNQSTNNSTNWALKSLTFTASSIANTISFRNTTGNDSLVGLDNVSLTAVSNEVPEPGTFSLGLAAVGLLACFARRK